MTRNALILIAAVGLAAAILILWRGSAATEAAVQDQAVIALGQRLYAENCASCHGADLEGQPDWQTPLENGRYPAPPHDETGHTWHHADPLLERIIRDGTAAVVGDGYESDMPGFGDVMSDAEIAAVLAYIKSTWPEREGAIQSRITKDSAP
ncbi:c-type cytochrome [Paracoccus sanguinis]|uniref:c-type cytochrome n=1 Tax=Paracoccus sanguinis TaxID=1545044 RepID=UPI001451221E|nr:cytochrome c [Paracoccus sanguinis]QJD16975.1 cytochrome c [Paracoccus sanguinis]